MGVTKMKLLGAIVLIPKYFNINHLKYSYTWLGYHIIDTTNKINILIL